MKTSNYLSKLPQEATIKNVQAFRDYDTPCAPQHSKSAKKLSIFYINNLSQI